MYKAFYVSGFLFHLKTQQILLHQPKQKNNTSPLWSMIGGTSHKEEDALTTFQRIAYKALNIKPDIKRIHPVYDYFHNTLNKVHYVFYIEVEKLQNYQSPQGGILSWFTFKQTKKLPFTDQTKQDIVVAERVIKAQAREDEARLSVARI